jgi:hypothetical protein
MVVGDLIGPIAPILGGLGAVIGACIGAAVTFIYVVKRKRVLFTIEETEDLLQALRAEDDSITINISGSPVSSFNRCRINVKNVGNTAIQNFQFDVTTGVHRGYFAIGPLGNDESIRSAIDLGLILGPTGGRVMLPFFNKGEEFGVVLQFDGPAIDCEVSCRMEDVVVKVKKIKGINANEIGVP